MNEEDFGSTQVRSSMNFPGSHRDDDESYGKYFDKKDVDLSPSQWVLFADSTYKAASTTKAKLPSGVYDINIDNMDQKIIFTKKKLLHDTLIPLSGLPSQIIKEINDFWTKEELFKSLGFLHRRGYLFYGSHGTGKSSLVHEIVDNIVKNGGIVFYCDNPGFFNLGLSLFRKVEPTRKIVCVFEDIDAIIQKFGESTILSVLDGENQISNVCNIATTNYPELLDKRIVGRPRRFDRVHKISNLDDKARKAYLKIKLPKKTNVDLWLKKTEGLSIAQISEVIISVFCFEFPLDEAVEIMKGLKKDKSSNEYEEKSLGFISSPL